LTARLAADEAGESSSTGEPRRLESAHRSSKGRIDREKIRIRSKVEAKKKAEIANSRQERPPGGQGAGDGKIKQARLRTYKDQLGPRQRGMAPITKQRPNQAPCGVGPRTLENMARAILRPKGKAIVIRAKPRKKRDSPRFGASGSSISNKEPSRPKRRDRIRSAWSEKHLAN